MTEIVDLNVIVSCIDKAVNNHRDEIKSIYMKIGQEISDSFKENNIASFHRSLDGKGWVDSWASIIAHQRVSSSFDFDLLYVLMDINHQEMSNENSIKM
jgi:F0F1-type ATP synthase alpha subunit